MPILDLQAGPVWDPLQYVSSTKCSKLSAGLAQISIASKTSSGSCVSSISAKICNVHVGPLQYAPTWPPPCLQVLCVQSGIPAGSFRECCGDYASPEKFGSLYSYIRLAAQLHVPSAQGKATAISKSQ